MDPGQMFDMMSGGKSEIVISEQTDQRRQMFLNMIAQRAGITNGKITRDQYVTAMQNRQQFRGGGGGVPQQAGAPAPGAAAAGAPGQGAADANAMNQDAEAEFKRQDLNGDGFLNPDEMQGRLRREWQMWDTNKDGKIDLTEFKAYYASQVQRRQQQQFGGGGQATAVVEEEEKKPPVYRAGKLPQGIPAWFAQYDKDNDGQIGLYEWKSTGRPIDEFLAMDKNQDGFLTINEVMAFEKAKKAKAAPGQPSAAPAPNPDGQVPPSMPENGGGNPAWQGGGRQGRGGQGMPAWNGGQGQRPGGDPTGQGRQGRGGGRRNRGGNRGGN
jgi:Ca2+-binding EF-hand superfamily protein